MMQSISEKGEKEKHEEQFQFAACKKCCDDTTVEKKHAIESANDQIKVFNGDTVECMATAANCRAR